MSGRYEVVDKDEFIRRNVLKTRMDQSSFEYIKNAFQDYLGLNSPQLDKNELIDVLTNKYELDIKDENLNEIFKEVDQNGFANIDFDQFIEIICGILANNCDDRQVMVKIFEMIIGDENTDRVELRHLKKKCPNLTDEELKKMIEKASSEKDGTIKFEDFYDILAKKI